MFQRGKKIFILIKFYHYSRHMTCFSIDFRAIKLIVRWKISFLKSGLKNTNSYANHQSDNVNRIARYWKTGQNWTWGRRFSNFGRPKNWKYIVQLLMYRMKEGIGISFYFKMQSSRILSDARTCSRHLFSVFNRNLVCQWKYLTSVNQCELLYHFCVCKDHAFERWF